MPLMPQRRYVQDRKFEQFTGLSQLKKCIMWSHQCQLAGLVLDKKLQCSVYKGRTLQTENKLAYNPGLLLPPWRRLALHFLLGMAPSNQRVARTN